MSNLGKDLADSKALLYALHQLDPVQCPLDGLNETDDLKRAEEMIINAMAYGAADLVGAEDILQGNSKVNLVLVTELFDVWHAKSCAPQPEVLNTQGSIEDELKKLHGDTE